MMSHTFAICAYKDSPYLDACIHSLKRQSVKSKIILCTSTPSPFLEAMAKIHDIPLYVRDGKSDIQDDWNFACEKADTRLVTIAHQDDCYHRDTRPGCSGAGNDTRTPRCSPQTARS